MAWKEELGASAKLTAQEIIAESEDFDHKKGVFTHPNLRDSCLEIAQERGPGNKVSPQRLGRWLTKNQGNRIEKAKLTADRTDGRRVRWSIAEPIS